MNHPPIFPRDHPETDVAIVSEANDSSDESNTESVNSNMNMLNDTNQEWDNDPDNPPFFCSRMDDEDEDWVYKNMRGGRADSNAHQTTTTQTATRQNSTTSDAAEHAQKVRKVTQSTSSSSSTSTLKPRHSDAILSCPYCFNTVCMDCQKHERKHNQYRAMFFMNIKVQWNVQLIYDSTSNELRSLQSTNIGFLTKIA